MKTAGKYPGHRIHDRIFSRRLPPAESIGLEPAAAGAGPLSRGPAPGEGDCAARWEIRAQTDGVPTSAEVLPGPHLQPIGGEGTGEWRSSGEYACFRLPGLSLPAGWYELEGALQSVDGSVLAPSLYPTYARGIPGDARIPLPCPPSSGSLRALVLLKYDVSGLRFCPGMGRVHFSMGAFSLRRISRGQALLKMLGVVDENTGVSAGLIRAARFALRGAREGISRATQLAFEDYLRRVRADDDDSYDAWVRQFDTLSEERLVAMQDRARTLESTGPLISILLPVYQTPERWLRRCIDSVIAQAYRRWQLCIVDDASPDHRVMDVLEEYARGDQRILVERRSVNGHIAEASNSALELALGDYVALLDHDDELRPHALLEAVEAIAGNDDVGLLYSDEDKIDAEGRRFDPYFKPDFDPDLLRSQNYVCHLSVIRTGLVREVGGFRRGFEGSQDHDLLLRCTERLLPTQVIHIPQILYHWRAIPGSTALARDAKDYATPAGVRAVEEHLGRCHPGARAEGLPHGHYRVYWPLPAPPPKVSLIIPTRDKVELLRMCVESILAKTTYPRFEIIVVDNQSRETATLAWLGELERNERVRVLRYDAPFNYSAINNWAVRQCDGEVIGLVNNDIEVISPDWLEEMVSHAVRPEIGVVGAMLYYPDDMIQHAGVILGVHGVAAHAYAGMPRGYPGHGGRARVAQGLSAVTGACMLLRREVHERVGGLDERLQIAFNDIDLCLRIREHGYRNIWTPFAELRHHESASRGSEDTPEKQHRFAREVEFMGDRWGTLLPNDPAYNPNLSLLSRHSELAFPPREWLGPQEPSRPAGTDGNEVDCGS